MGTITKHGPFEGSQCSWCANTAHGYWTARNTIFCCRICALDVLPRLFADSIHYFDDNALTEAENQLATFRANFYRTFASRIQHHKEKVNEFTSPK